MISTTLRIEGSPATAAAIRQALQPLLEANVREAGVAFQGELRRVLTGQRSGRVYRVSRTGRLHTASAPGEPPAVLTGALRNSIAVGNLVLERDSVSVEVGTNQPQAERLEYGGRDMRGVYIAPRPYFRPAAVQSRERIEAILNRGIR